jgi:ribonuclease Z
MIHFYFLGTSSGVPTKTRNVTGLALRPSHKKRWFLIDCGEGTQHRLQHAGLTLHDLSAVFITHMHGDHTLGLPGLLSTASMNGRTAPLTLVGPAPLIEWWQATERLTDSHLTYPLNFVAVEPQAKVYEHEGIVVTRHALEHRIPSYAYRFAVRYEGQRLRSDALAAAGLPKGPLWGELMKGLPVSHDGKTFHPDDWLEQLAHQAAAIVAGDNATPSVLHDACKDAQVLVHESTYLQALLDKVGPGPMHSSAKLLAEFAQAAQLPNLIMTHLSARYHLAEGEAQVLDEARAHYNGSLHLADDGDVFRLEADGRLVRQESFLSWKGTSQSPEN